MAAATVRLAISFRMPSPLNPCAFRQNTEKCQPIRCDGRHKMGVCVHCAIAPSVTRLMGNVARPIVVTDENENFVALLDPGEPSTNHALTSRVAAIREALGPALLQCGLAQHHATDNADTEHIQPTMRKIE
jgi:hypothetical protein